MKLSSSKGMRIASIGILTVTLGVLSAAAYSQASSVYDNIYLMSDSQGDYGFYPLANVVDHFQGRPVDGVKINAGGKTWGYLVNTTKATGKGYVPQLYVHNYPFDLANTMGAPILFDNETTGGNNRAIAIQMKDTSTQGPLNATGLAISVDTPPDRGGDSSGIWINQTGGGNAMSIYKLSSTYPNNGFAIEVRANGKATTVWSGTEDGVAYMGSISGQHGTGVSIFPMDDVPSTARAYRVSNRENSKEMFYATVGGDLYARGTTRLGGNVQTFGDVQHAKLSGAGNAFACLDSAGKLFRSDAPCR